MAPSGRCAGGEVDVPDEFPDTGSTVVDSVNPEATLVTVSGSSPSREVITPRALKNLIDSGTRISLVSAPRKSVDARDDCSGEVPFRGDMVDTMDGSSGPWWKEGWVVG